MIPSGATPRSTSAFPQRMSMVRARLPLIQAAISAIPISVGIKGVVPPKTGTRLLVGHVTFISSSSTRICGPDGLRWAAEYSKRFLYNAGATGQGRCVHRRKGRCSAVEEARACVWFTMLGQRRRARPLVEEQPDMAQLMKRSGIPAVFSLHYGDLDWESLRREAKEINPKSYLKR